MRTTLHAGIPKYQSGCGAFDASIQLLNEEGKSVADASVFMREGFVSFSRILFTDSVNPKARRQFITDCEHYMKTAESTVFSN